MKRLSERMSAALPCLDTAHCYTSTGVGSDALCKNCGAVVKQMEKEKAEDAGEEVPRTFRVTPDPDKFWFVSYVLRVKIPGEHISKAPILPMNVVLAGVHPFRWVADPSEIYTSYILSFQQVDEEAFLMAKEYHYISVEDWRDRPVTITPTT